MIGKQSTLNDLKQLEATSNNALSVAQQALSAANSLIPAENDGSSAGMMAPIRVNYDVNLREYGHFFIDKYSCANVPLGEYGFLSCLKTSHSNGATREVFYAESGRVLTRYSSNSGVGEWILQYGSANTIVDANGFIKQA